MPQKLQFLSFFCLQSILSLFISTLNVIESKTSKTRANTYERFSLKITKKLVILGTKILQIHAEKKQCKTCLKKYN